MDNDISEAGGSRTSGEEPGGTLFGVRCSRVVLALLALILIASLGIRLYRIDSPSDFHVISPVPLGHSRQGLLLRAIGRYPRVAAQCGRDEPRQPAPPGTSGHRVSGGWRLLSGRGRASVDSPRLLFPVLACGRHHAVLHWQEIRPLLGRRNSRILLSLSSLCRSRQPELPARPVDDHADAGEPPADPALQ